MTLRVSTTGSNVVLIDLGIEVTHPTVSRDLSLEFTAIELRDSADLTSAIQAGNLDVDDGTHFVHQDDYDPDELLIQELGYNRDELYISHDELASVNDILINKTGVFPLSLNSTASSTRNVYSAAARFITWHLEVDDIVEISGTTAADGTYTVESVTDQQNFIVVESIPDSTGGTTNIYHPGGATRIGVVDTDLNVVSGLNVQDVLESIDDALGQGGFSDQYVKVSTNDTTADYLGNKLTAGSGITITEVNDGGDETLEISTISVGGIDLNRIVLDCDGSFVYIGEGDIVICDNALPGPVLDTNCDD